MPRTTSSTHPDSEESPPKLCNLALLYPVNENAHIDLLIEYSPRLYSCSLQEMCSVSSFREVGISMHLTQKWMDAVAASSTGQCLVASGTSDIYSKVTEPTLAPSHLQGMQLSLLNDQLPENAAGFLLLLDFLSQLPFLLQL